MKLPRGVTPIFSVTEIENNLSHLCGRSWFSVVAIDDSKILSSNIQACQVNQLPYSLSVNEKESIIMSKFLARISMLCHLLLSGRRINASPCFSSRQQRGTPTLPLQGSLLLRKSTQQSLHDNTIVPRLLAIRGGAKKGTVSTASKKKKPSLTKKKKPKSDDNRQEISKALHEKDTAHAMGDAIRQRADQWRPSPVLVDSIDASLSSVGLAMGAADHGDYEPVAVDTTAAAGGVEAATTSVVVHYFLKSHGGAHAVQSVCSILAAASGLGATVLPQPQVSLALLRRCMIFAMTKHLAGILAACVLTARAVPEIGLTAARQRMQDLVQDPVAQYVFYAACLLVWLPAKMATEPLWWQQSALIPILLTGPILLREVISTLFVLSDVILLWVYSNQPVDNEGNASQSINPPWMVLIRAGQAIVNAAMSLLVTPTVWRTADALQRQAILARLVSRVSLVFEVLVGAVLAFDALQGAARWGLSTSSSSSSSTQPRPSLVHVVRCLICVRLYVNFLWTRRRKIERLATRMRGGAAELPMYLLNAMLDPMAAMGISGSEPPVDNDNSSSSTMDKTTSPAGSAWWRTYLRLAMGMEDD